MFHTELVFSYLITNQRRHFFQLITECYFFICWCAGDTIDGREAHRIGLVSQCVPDAELETATDALAQRIASIPMCQLLLHKRLINQVGMGYCV